jgi:ABC-type branched-subunit amino acid transport system ATPase component
VSLLRVKGLTKRFGGLTALDDVDLEVEAGQIRGLIGPNGSGKTTFFNVVCGIFPPEAGSIAFKDETITRLSPHQVCEKGLARTFQEVQLMYDMTVLENAMIGVHRLSKAGVFDAVLSLPWVVKEENFIEEKARECLSFVGLPEGLEYELARNISYGHQRLLDIAKCLASDPDLLLLDEPTAGMNITETRHLMELIRRIRDQGTSVLLVEHDMHLIMNVCDVISCLNHGVKIADDEPGRIQADQQVIEAYLGSQRRQEKRR